MASETEIQAGAYASAGEDASEDDFLTLLREYENRAKAYGDELSNKRVKELHDYHRGGYEGDDEREGLSTFVSSDFFDAVETILPDMLDVFFAGDSIVEFQPRKKDEEQSAEMATKAVNYVFGVQNNGFLTVYTALKDALMHGLGGIHWYTAQKEHVEVERHDGLSEDDLAVIQADGELELIAAIPREVPMIMDGIEVMMPVYDVELRRTSHEMKVIVDPIAPEELLVYHDHTTPILSDCRYVCLKRLVTASDLREMGYDISDEELSEPDETRTQESEARGGTGEEHNDLDPTLREVWLRTEFVLSDRDGDGIAERRKVVRLAGRILSDDPYSHVPVAMTSPYLKQHRWDGMSLHEVVHDLQKLHTELFREMKDSLAFANTPRLTTLTDANGNSFAEMDDLLDGRIGGVIRINSVGNPQGTGAVGQLNHQWVGGQALPLLENVQGMRENRLGITRYNQGLDANSLNKTATGLMAIMSASQRKQKLMARIIAETLFKPMSAGVLKLLTEGPMGTIAARIDDEYVEMDPSTFRGDYELIINVGMGTGNKQEQTGVLQGMVSMAMNMINSPMGSLVTPDRVYKMLAQIAENSGFKQPERFWLNPESTEAQERQKQAAQQPQPPNPEIEIKKMDIQAAQAQAEIEARIKSEAEARSAELRMREAEIKGNNDLQLMLEKARLAHGERLAEIETRKEIELAKANVQLMREAEATKRKQEQANAKSTSTE